jgi:hypothetical protein
MDFNIGMSIIDVLVEVTGLSLGVLFVLSFLQEATNCEIDDQVSLVCSFLICMMCDLSCSQGSMRRASPSLAPPGVGRWS